MNKTFKNRPTGENLDEYCDHEKWSSSHWAWQFLRRNKDFYKVCRDIQKCGADDAHKRKVAKHFGLVHFKSASEPYAGKFKKPKFRLLAPHMYIRMTEGDTVKIPRTVDVGELVVRINLRPATLNKGLLDLQLGEVARLANAKLLDFAKASGLDLPKDRRVRGGQKASDLDLLRMLDLMFAGRPRKEIVGLLFPEELEPKESGKSWDRFYDGVKGRAEAMTDFGYLKLIRADKKRTSALVRHKSS